MWTPGNFVDDVARQTISKKYSGEGIMAGSEAAHKSLKERCGVMGVAVHSEKRVTQPRIAGAGAQESMNKWYGDKGEWRAFRAEEAARYQGPRASIDDSVGVELGIRIEAANKAYYTVAGLWGANVGFWIKRVTFRGVYMATLLSGLAAFALRKSDYSRLETEIAKKARKVVGQWGVKKKTGGKFESRSNW